jgi:parallel beta-helix repeat protein
LKRIFLELLALLLIGVLSLAFDVQPAKTEPVMIVVPDEYPTIQEAINAAGEGDTIFVRNGTYYENVVVNKSLAIIAESKDAIITQNYTDVIVEVCADNIIVEGFTIQGSNCLGIVLNSSSNSEIKNNRVEPGLGTGIVICGGFGNKIVENDIERCSSYGIIVEDSIGNLIMQNSMNAHIDALLLINSNSNIIYYNYFAVHFSPESNICLCSSYNNTIEANTLFNDSPEGECRIQLFKSGNNLIFHNNFNGWKSSSIYLDANSTSNVWDNGYPSGGNYWIDYDGTDLFSGSNQDMPGSDGIGDTPHVITENNVDRYPLMNPYWNPGDVNDDFKIDIYDVVLICAAYGTTPSDPEWNPRADIAEPYGVIDMQDVVKCTTYYGETYQ